MNKSTQYLLNEYKDFVQQEAGSCPILRALLKEKIQAFKDSTDTPLSPIDLAHVVEQVQPRLRSEIWPLWQGLLEGPDMVSKESEVVSDRLWDKWQTKAKSTSVAPSSAPYLILRFVLQEWQHYRPIAATLVTKLRGFPEDQEEGRNWDIHLTDFRLYKRGEVHSERCEKRHHCRQLGDLLARMAEVRNKLRTQKLNLEDIVSEMQKSPLHKWSVELLKKGGTFGQFLREALDLAASDKGYCQVVFEISATNESIPLFAFPFELTFVPEVSKQDLVSLGDYLKNPESPGGIFLELNKDEERSWGVFCVLRVRREREDKWPLTPLSIVHVHPDLESSQLPKVNVHIINFLSNNSKEEEVQAVMKVWDTARLRNMCKNVHSPNVVSLPRDKIMRYLQQEIDPESWHVVHIVAHGQMDYEGGIIEIRAGEERRGLVRPEELIELLKGKPVKLIVLSVCESGAGSSDYPEAEVQVPRSSFIEDFVRETDFVVPMLIGYRCAIDTTSSKELVYSMYENFLFWRDDWPVALLKARKDLQEKAQNSESRVDPRAWLAPVLVHQGASFYYD